MSHDAHEALPGYTRDQILHSGCRECDGRAAEPDGGLGHLDPVRFAQAWARAARWQQGGGNLPDLDPAEVRMLASLWSVQVHLEVRGFPVGVVPENWMAKL